MNIDHPRKQEKLGTTVSHETNLFETLLPTRMSTRLFQVPTLSLQQTFPFCHFLFRLYKKKIESLSAVKLCRHFIGTPCTCTSLHTQKKQHKTLELLKDRYDCLDKSLKNHKKKKSLKKKYQEKMTKQVKILNYKRCIWLQFLRRKKNFH